MGSLVLFIIGGALAHVVNLATHANYASFADPAMVLLLLAEWRAAAAAAATPSAEADFLAPVPRTDAS